MWNFQNMFAGNVDVSSYLDRLANGLDVVVGGRHFKAMLHYYRQSVSEFPNDYIKAIDCLLDKIHEHFNCGVAYDFVRCYVRSEVSLEGLVVMYVITLTHAFGRDIDNRYCQGVLKLADGVVNYLRRFQMWWRLCDYKLRNQATWLTGPNSLTLLDLALGCFKEQIRDSYLVANIILGMYFEHGSTQVSALWSSPPEVQDPGVRLLRLKIKKPCYSRYSYYVRAFNDTKFKVGDLRLNLYMPNFIQEVSGSFHSIKDVDIFHYGVRYPIRYYNDDLNPAPFRPIIIFAIRFLPMYIRSLGDYTDIYMFLVRQEVRGLLQRNDQYTEFEMFLVYWDLMFRTITDPLVSLAEIREYCKYTGKGEDVEEAICFSYSTLFPNITTEVFTPRSLRHLTRCAIRKALYEAWQQPEAVLDLEYSDELKSYVNIEVP